MTHPLRDARDEQIERLREQLAAERDQPPEDHSECNRVLRAAVDRHREAKEQLNDLREVFRRGTAAAFARWTGGGFVTAVALFFLGYGIHSCATAPDRLRAGFVTGKDYHPPYTTYQQVGKVLMPVYHPAWWEVDIADGRRTTVVTVTEEAYGSARPGRWECYSSPCPPEPR